MLIKECLPALVKQNWNISKEGRDRKGHMCLT